MRCIFRQLRRPAVVLPLLYLAGFGVLAVVLPPQPRCQFEAKEACFLVGFSPDGDYLATCPVTSYTMNQAAMGVGEGPIRVWDLKSAAGSRSPEGTEIPNRGLLQSLAESPGGRRVFWSALHGRIDLRLLLKAIGPARDEALPDLSSFSPNGDTFAYLLADGGVPRAAFNRDYSGPVTLDLLAVESGRRILSAPDQVVAWAFSPDGTILTTLHSASAERRESGRTCRTIRWNCLSGRPLQTATWDAVRGAVRLSADGAWLIEQYEEPDRLAVYDVITGRRCVAIPEACEYFPATPGGIFIAGFWGTKSSPCRLEFWDLMKGENRGQFSHSAGEGRPPTPVAISSTDNCGTNASVS